MAIQRFRSRVDPWLAVVVFVPLIFVLFTLAMQVRQLSISAIVLGGGLMLLALALTLWIFLDTSYTVGDTELTINSGPLRISLPLTSIRSIRRSNTWMAAPALSLRRLELDHGTLDPAIISPADQSGFIEAVLERAPSVAVEMAN